MKKHLMYLNMKHDRFTEHFSEYTSYSITYQYTWKICN